MESSNFQKFVNILNPSYELPSRKTLSNSLLSAEYEKCVSHLKVPLDKIAYVAITTDGWTSINNESFYAVTAHFLTDDCELYSGLLSTFKFTGQHTSQNIVDQLKTILTE